MMNDDDLYLRAAFECNPVGMILIDHETSKIRGYNKSYLRVWNTDETIVNSNHPERLVEHMANQLVDATQLMARHLRLQETPDQTSFDTLAFKDGRTVERTSQPLMVEGKLVGRVWFFRDITENLKAHRDLEAEREKATEREIFSRKILDSLPLLVAHVDNEARYKFVNKAYLEWFKIPTDSFLGKTMSTILGPELYPKIKNNVELALKGTASDFEAPGMYDGTMKRVHVRYVPSRKTDGSPDGFYIVVSDVTKIRTLESETESKGAQLQTLFDNLAEGINLQDRNGNVLQANASCLKILGRSPVEIDGKSVYAMEWRFVAEDMSPLAQPDIPSAVALRTGRPQKNKIVGVYRPNGELVWLSVTAVPLFPNKKGIFQQVLIAFSDITESKKNEKTLEAMNERRSITFTALHYGTWDWNLKTNALAWDDFMYTLYDVDKADFTGAYDAFAKTLDEGEDVRVQKDLEKTFAAQDSEFRNTFRVKSRSGIKYIASCARCFYDQDGKIERLVGANWEITENVLRSRALESSQQLLRQIIDSTPDWIFVKDKEHRYLLANSSFAKAVSKKPEDLLGKDDLELGFPEEIVKGNPAKGISGFWPDDDQVFKSGETQIIPVDPAVIGGKTIHFHTLKIPLRNERNEVHAVLGYSRDLTVLREKDQLLDAQQAQLLTASKMSSLGEMAGGIAHEINNPLAIIVGQSARMRGEITAGKSSPEKICGDLSKLETTAFRIAKIIKGLRTFSRNSEADPMVRAKFSQIVEDTLTLCNERFKDHSIDLRVKIEDFDLNCRATQISQVLMNLINNAHDAVEHLPEKWVSLEAVIKSGEAEISVTDSGGGIPLAVVEKMMNPFFTTKELGKGTGLGLSISKGIVEIHGGTLSYDSTTQHTRFVIRVPISSEEETTKVSA